jgi:hypothetical protein
MSGKAMAGVRDTLREKRSFIAEFSEMTRFLAFNPA